MDATAWGAIGGGLTALSEGLTAMELRRLAKEREKEERERQKEEAALRKAQLKAQEFQNMDARNFKKVSENGQVTNKANANALLNAAAFGRGGEQVKGDISGDTYYRAAGDSPNDQKRAQEEARLAYALEKVQQENQRALEIQKLKGQQALDVKGTLGEDTKYKVDGTVKAAGIRANAPSKSSGSGAASTASADRRRAAILKQAQELARPRYDRETMETIEGLPWDEAIRVGTQLVDAAEGKPAATQSGGTLRKATDAEVMEGMKAVGNDPAKLRAWLKQRGLTE